MAARSRNRKNRVRLPAGREGKTARTGLSGNRWKATGSPRLAPFAVKYRYP